MSDLGPLFADEWAIREQWGLPNQYIGRDVVVFSQIDSTNTQALRLGHRPELHGLALLADEQQAGRGQHGRSWLARRGACVLLSVLLFPPDALTRPVLLTALAAVAVCRLVRERTGLLPSIKWPNDVLVGNRKIAGILIEQSRQSQKTAVVIGIGLNVTPAQSDLAAAGLPAATSLAACGDPQPKRDPVARRLLELLDEHYACLVQDNASSLESQWGKFLNLTDCDVLVETHEDALTGILAEVRFAGLRLVQPGTGSLILPPESIRHISRH